MCSIIYFTFWLLAYCTLPTTAIPATKAPLLSASSLALPRDVIPNNSPKLSVTPFEPIIVNSEGRDISRSNELFHQRHDLSPSKSKRDFPRPINKCHAPFEFANSHCDKIDPQKYQVTCIREDGDRIQFWDMCSWDEYCVERFDPNVGVHNDNAMSFCVKRNSVVSLGYTRVERVRYLDIRSHIPLTNGGAYSVSAVLMDLNGRLLINASSITIEEQKTELVHNAPLLHTLPGEIASCSDCSRFGIPSIIEGTQRALLSVVLPVNVAAAALLVTTFKR